MGRRYPKTPPDTGEPGKFYFTEPDVIQVKGKAKPAWQSTYGSNVINLTPGRCKLESSHNMHQYVPPEDCVYDLNDYPSQLAVNEYLRRMAIAGFGEGAIVTRRHQNKGRWKHPSQWGLIVIMNKHAHTSAKFRPYSVRWFSNNDVEGAFAEDLVVIHAAIEESILQDIVEEQGVEV